MTTPRSRGRNWAARHLVEETVAGAGGDSSPADVELHRARPRRAVSKTRPIAGRNARPLSTHPTAVAVRSGAVRPGCDATPRAAPGAAKRRTPRRRAPSWHSAGGLRRIPAERRGDLRRRSRGAGIALEDVVLPAPAVRDGDVQVLAGADEIAGAVDRSHVAMNLG